MASFRAHFSFGILIGIAAVATAVSFALSDGSAFFLSLFLAAVVGGVMPDMDSDSGVPFHVTFGVLSLVAGSLAFLHVFGREHTVGELVGWTFGAALLVWAVAGSVFRRFTRHRGMAHSVPSAALSGLVTFLLAGRYGFPDGDAFLLAIALMAGYLGHLVLDELYAAVDFHGTPFVPNRAFGSALKFFSRDRSVNLAVYGSIAFLLTSNWAALSRLSEAFLGSLR